MAELLTQREIAEYLDLDVRSIRNLEKLGLPTRSVKPKGGNGTPEKRYPWPAALHWYIRYKATPPKKEKSDAKRLLKAQARKTEAQAAKEELSLLERQQLLMAVDDVERELEEILRNLRAGLLTFAPRWAPEIVGLETVGAARAKLDTAIEELMLQLVRKGDADAPEDAGSVDDAADDDPADDDDDDDEGGPPPRGGEYFTPEP
jgi:phage terminase Nu1 subunit (DNA packaging protein)